jgi:hypothetical protein
MDDRFKQRRANNGNNEGTGRLSGGNNANGGTGRLSGNGKGPNPRPIRALPDPQPQENPFAVRLDPSSQPGEFNFVIDAPNEMVRQVPQSGLTAEATGGIPPQLHPAVNEVLAFIYELDQQAERKGRKR